MSRTKPGRVARIPDSVAETWDGLFELARREAARRVGAEPETVTAAQVWSDMPSTCWRSATAAPNTGSS